MSSSQSAFQNDKSVNIGSDALQRAVLVTVLIQRLIANLRNNRKKIRWCLLVV
jgi:hypothetical protein